MVVAFLFPLFLLVALLNTAHGCSCAITPFEVAYYRSQQNGTPFSRARVITSTLSGGIRRYGLKVSFVWDNCTRNTPFSAIAETSDSSAACGVLLTVGKTYILQLKQLGTSQVNLCGVNILESSLTASQRSFLDTRQLCCKGKCRCANSNIVTCIRAPCDPRFESPPCPPESVKCVDNFCGGCIAEWFTSSMLPACLSWRKIALACHGIWIAAMISCWVTHSKLIYCVI